jgi:hypothetical protein
VDPYVVVSRQLGFCSAVREFQFLIGTLKTARQLGKASGAKGDRKMEKSMFFNGKEVSQENLVQLIVGCMEQNWNNSDIHREYEIALEFLATGNYSGHDEDMNFVLEKLQDEFEPNLQNVADILREGGKSGWYFQTLSEYQNRISDEID